MLGRPDTVLPVFIKVWARVVVDRFRVRRPHDAQVVGDFRQVNEQLVHLLTALAVLLEAPLRARSTVSLLL